MHVENESIELVMIAPEILFTEIDQNMSLLLNVTTGELHQLDEIGTLIIGLLMETASFEELVSFCLKSFDEVEEKLLCYELDHFIKYLSKLEIVEVRYKKGG